MDGVLGGKWEKMQREVALPNCKQICRLSGVMLSVLTCYWTQSLRARRWVFKGDKNQQEVFLRRGSKAVGYITKNFTVCKNRFEE
jgi:hypothetical protein